MLKDYKIGKTYEYFSSGWRQEGYFLKAKLNNNNNLGKIAHHWLQSLLLLSNGPELALHRQIENLINNMHKFHTLQCKNNKLLLSNHHLVGGYRREIS
jgi:hypothetical protein